MIKTEFGNGRIRNDGYIQITTTENKGKLFHRLVYEKHYGSIPEGFCVHHINGDKTDNTPENLMLLSKSHHHRMHMQSTNHPGWNKGKIDAYGGINFISAEKNKGKTMQDIADECGYKNVSSIFHYLDKRGLRWNQL